MIHLKTVCEAILKDITRTMKVVSEIHNDVSECSTCKVSTSDAVSVIQIILKDWSQRISVAIEQGDAPPEVNDVLPEVKSIPVKAPANGFTPQQEMIADMTLALSIMEKDYEKSGFRISLRIKTFESLKEAISRWSGQINSLPLIEPELWAYMVKKLGGLPKIREDFEANQPMDVALNLQSEIAKTLRDRFNPEGNLEPREEMERVASYLENQITLMIVAQEANLKGE